MEHLVVILEMDLIQINPNLSIKPLPTRAYRTSTPYTTLSTTIQVQRLSCTFIPLSFSFPLHGLVRFTPTPPEPPQRSIGSHCRKTLKLSEINEVGLLCASNARQSMRHGATVGTRLFRWRLFPPLFFFPLFRLFERLSFDVNRRRSTRVSPPSWHSPAGPAPATFCPTRALLSWLKTLLAEIEPL